MYGIWTPLSPRNLEQIKINETGAENKLNTSEWVVVDGGLCGVLNGGGLILMNICELCECVAAVYNRDDG